MLIGESNVAIDPAIGGYGVADIYLGEFSPTMLPHYVRAASAHARRDFVRTKVGIRL